MLTAIEVTNSQGDVLSLPLEDNDLGYILQNIEGLDPVKATLVSSSFANMDGAQYHSSRREARNIKMQLGLDANFETNSVRTLRNQLYKFFMPKTEVNIRFKTFNEFDPSIVTQNLTVDILGRIEECGAPLFTKDPAVDISFVCFDPDFKDPNLGIFTGVSTAGLGEQLITYEGTVETGIVFILQPTRIVDSFTIYHRPPDGTLRMLEFTAPLLAGDVLRISTSVGEKSVIRTRAGVDSSMLYAQSPQSDWLELQPGDNYIRVYAVGAAVPFEIDYIKKHGGL
jgi:hypothetical protein